jgi:hypothetical protein
MSPGWFSGFFSEDFRKGLIHFREAEESMPYSSSKAAPDTEPPPWFQNTTAVRFAG